MGGLRAYLGHQIVVRCTYLIVTLWLGRPELEGDMLLGNTDRCEN
jgi:hypothetical protein